LALSSSRFLRRRQWAFRRSWPRSRSSHLTFRLLRLSVGCIIARRGRRPMTDSLSTLGKLSLSNTFCFDVPPGSFRTCRAYSPATIRRKNSAVSEPGSGLPPIRRSSRNATPIPLHAIRFIVPTFSLRLTLSPERPTPPRQPVSFSSID
jgi:hypothetical protein